jgi:hypothetical protein
MRIRPTGTLAGLLGFLVGWWALTTKGDTAHQEDQTSVSTDEMAKEIADSNAHILIRAKNALALMQRFPGRFGDGWVGDFR